jgi:hypothetical protein
MPDDPIEALFAVLPGSLVGGALMVACAGLGWWASRNRRGWLARSTGYWLDHVVRPLLARRTWAGRAVIIAANNSLVCFVLVVVGPLGRAAWLAVAIVGLGLGAGLRLIIDLAEVDVPSTDLRRRQRVMAGLGIALNMLEPPAILLSIGLGLTQGAMTAALELGPAAVLYGRFVLPMLLLAATGEALWMTVYGVGTTSIRQNDTR